MPTGQAARLSGSIMTHSLIATASSICLGVPADRPVRDGAGGVTCKYTVHAAQDATSAATADTRTSAADPGPRRGTAAKISNAAKAPTDAELLNRQPKTIEESEEGARHMSLTPIDSSSKEHGARERTKINTEMRSEFLVLLKKSSNSPTPGATATSMKERGERKRPRAKTIKSPTDKGGREKMESVIAWGCFKTCLWTSLLATPTRGPVCFPGGVGRALCEG